MVLSEQAYRKIDREIGKFPADQKQSAVMAALAIARDPFYGEWNYTISPNPKPP